MSIQSYIIIPLSIGIFFTVIQRVSIYKFICRILTIIYNIILVCILYIFSNNIVLTAMLFNLQEIKKKHKIYTNTYKVSSSKTQFDF